MAVITDYASLLTEVANTLTRDNLTAEIPQFVQFAENKLFRTLNLRDEETVLSVDVVGGVARVPTGFKKLKFARYNSTPVSVLSWVPLTTLYAKNPVRSVVTTPCLIAREGNNFIFGPVATDATAGLQGIYYKKSTASRTAIATDATGDPDGSTGTIPGMADTSDFFVGDSVTVSDGFPSTTDGYKILAKTSTSVTLDTLSTSAETDVTVTALANFYITDAPEVLLYGALLEAIPLIKDDPRIPMWKGFFSDAIQTLKDENDNAETSDGPIIQRPS